MSCCWRVTSVDGHAVEGAFAFSIGNTSGGDGAALLERLGYDVVTSDVECCGMAGSFGYKSEYYDLSVDVGETLAAQFAGDERDRRRR